MLFQKSIMMAAQNGACKTVLAGSIAKSLLAEVQEGLKTIDRPPRLYGFLANKDPAARMYADWTAKTCKEKYEFIVDFICSTLRTDRFLADSTSS